jgi:hypothetical protein
MTSKEKPNENLYELTSGIFGQTLNGYPLQCSDFNSSNFTLKRFGNDFFFENFLRIDFRCAKVVF